MPEPQEARDAAPAALESTTDPPRNFVWVFAPSEGVERRVDPTALSNYCGVIQTQLRRIEQNGSSRDGWDVQVGVALFPGGRREIDVQTAPFRNAESLLEAVRSKVEAVPAPPVHAGPVGVLIRQALWRGAAAVAEDGFSFPFLDRRPLHRPVSYDEFLRLLSGDKPRRLAALVEQTRFALRRFLDDWFCAATLDGRLLRWRPLRRLFRSRIASLLERWDRRAGDATVDDLSQWIRRRPAHPKYWWMRSRLGLAAERFHEAAADSTAVLDRLGPAPAVLVRRAFAQLNLSRRASALADLNAALAVDPRCADALRMRGVLYLDLEAFEDAADDLKTLVDLEPHVVLHRLALAQALFGRRRFRESLEALNEAARLDPNSAQIRAHRASLRLSGRLDDEDPRTSMELALADCDDAIAVEPECAMHWVQRASVRFRIGELAAAEEDASRAVQLDAECGPAYAVRGVCRQMLDRAEEGERDCARAIELNAAGPMTYVAKALSHAAQGDLEAALEVALAGIESEPEDPALLRCLGYIHLHQGAPQQAVDVLGEAVRRAPDWAVPYFERGVAHRILGRFEASIADLNRSIELSPEWAPAFYERGLSRIANGEATLAEGDFTRAVLLDETMASARLARAICRARLGRLEEALDDADKAAALDPQEPQAYLHRAQIRASLGDKDGAIDDYDQAILLRPNLGAAYFGRGGVWIQKGERDRARDDFQRAVECDPDSADEIALHRLLVEASHAIERERYAEALDYAAEALQRDETCAAARFLAGSAHWYAGEFVEAVDAFTRLVETAGESFAVLSARGQVLAELGECEQALVDLDRAVETAEASGEAKTDVAYARSGRALALVGLDRRDEAVRELERSIQDCPTNPWVYYNLGIAYHAARRSREASLCFQLALSLSEPALPPYKKAKARGYLERMGSDAVAQPDTDRPRLEDAP